MKRLFMGIFLILCAFTGVQAQEDSAKFSVGGYVKYLQSITFSGAPNSPTTTNLIHNRVNFGWRPNSHWEAVVEVRNRVFFGEEVKLTPNFARQVDTYPGLMDLSVRWAEPNGVLVHSIADRAYLRYTQAQWEVTLGRQRINWGRNLTWNPNDLFNTFNFLDFDYEERPGNDALRVRRYFGVASEADVAFAPDSALKNSIGAARMLFNVKGYDLQALAGYYRGDLALGLGWEGNIRSMGFRGEATWFEPLEPSPDTTGALSASLTLDYMTNDGWYLTLAGLYNQRGAQGGQANLGLAAALPSPKNLFPSEFAFIFAASKSVSPVLNLSVSGIYATDNQLTGIIPVVTYSIRENWDLDLVGQTFLGNYTGDYQHLVTAAFLRMKWSY